MKKTDTYWPQKESRDKKWHLIDASSQVLGRLSTRIAVLLVGKHKTIYTRSIDCGDFVVAVNIDKIRLTGNKLENKIYFRHTGWPGGGRMVPYKKLMADQPEKALFLAVKRMLPKNKLASRQILRLKMYRGKAHPHFAQFPQAAEESPTVKN